MLRRVCEYIHEVTKLSFSANIVQILAPALTLPVLARSILPILSTLVSDPIPNIRFNVAKSYAVIIDIFKRLPDSQTATIAQMEKDSRPAPEFTGSERGQQLVRDEVMPQLEKLAQDDDVDVRYFATKAAKAWTDSAMET